MKPEPPVPLVKQKGRPPSANSTAQLRRCRRHGLIEFHRLSEGNGRYRWRCKRCVGESVTRRKQRVKQILVAEAGGRCVLCGYDRCVVSLGFHHVDPETKSPRPIRAALETRPARRLSFAQARIWRSIALRRLGRPATRSSGGCPTRSGRPGSASCRAMPRSRRRSTRT